MSRASRHRRPAGIAILGLSLIELMVALTIGAFLVLGVTTVFIANKSSSELETSLARLQENGRFALDLIADDLYQTQYLGCNTGDVFLVDMINDPNSPGFSGTLEGIRGYEKFADGSWAPDPNLPAAMTTGTDPIRDFARDGSDVLGMRMNERLATNLSSQVLPASAAVNVVSNPGCALEQGSRVVLTGCSLTAHLFRVTNTISCSAATAGNPASLEFDNSGNFTTSFNTSYDLDAELLLFEEAYCFVADTGRERNGQPVFALYREVNGTRQEMIEGVENIQLKFGQLVDAAGSLRYVDPSDATLNTGLGYEGVRTVRFAILLQAFDEVADQVDTDNYRLIDVDIPASGSGAAHNGGRVLRKVFTRTINLRNAPEF